MRHILIGCALFLLAGVALAEAPPNSMSVDDVDIQRLMEHLQHGRPSFGPCKQTEERISYKGFKHCDLHPAYQKVFPVWGCNCATGECRPTTFKQVERTTRNPEGIQVMINDVYYDVPIGALHKEKDRMPAELLVWEAHVCTSEPPKPIIECVWVRLMG